MNELGDEQWGIKRKSLVGKIEKKLGQGRNYQNKDLNLESLKG